MTTLRLPSVLWLGSALLVFAGPPKAPDEFDEFDLLARQLAASSTWNMPRLRAEAKQPQALILPTDRSPVDVALRRTRALLHDLQRHTNLTAEAPQLAALERESVAHRVASAAEETQRVFFRKVTDLRRRIAFRNPLLNFDRIVFLKHNKQARGYRHMVDQYLGFNAEKSGGVFVLENAFGASPKVRSVLGQTPVQNGRLRGRILEDQGGFIGLDLDYDAETILFAFTEAEHALPPGASFADQYWHKSDIPRDPGAAHHFFRPESTYHIFKARLDGSSLGQLTDGRFNDIDPCFLPNGRIVFMSERAGGQVRCGMRPLPSGTLHGMMADGSDIIQMSWHDTQEWHPSVTHDGLLAYTRWDYVDRDSDVAHHIWTCYPDGRDPRSPHGNYPEPREGRPWMEMSIRAVPGSHKFCAVATPHHGQAFGSIVLIDPRHSDDRRSAQLQRVTPEINFPESEAAPGVPHKKGAHNPSAEVFGTPWPLSEDYYLCVFDPGQSNYGLYLIDSFGNRELLYRDPRIACLDPIPLRPRPRPPVIPVATTQAAVDQSAAPLLEETATVVVLNVYQSELPLPPGTRVTEIRVVNIYPKDNPFQDDPNIGVAAQSLGRGVLGTADVEPDGSAHFTIPSGAPVYFQLVDDHGLAVHTMRTDTYAHPGETLTCVGCHEHKHSPPLSIATGVPLALRRPPAKLKPAPFGAYPLTFPRLVQPVLDQKCLPCHQKEPKAPSLHGDHFGRYGWSEAFHTLRPFAFGRSGGNGVALTEPQYSTPGKEGARVSRLYRLLSAGHHDVQLTAAELARITLWLDCNSNFYAAYHSLEDQARGAAIAPRWGMPPARGQWSTARIP